MARKTRKPPRAPKLTKQQRAADRNPLYNPSTTLSGHRLSDAATAIAEAQFGPRIAEAGRQAANATMQGTALVKRAGDYYTQLADREGKAVAIQGVVGQQLRGNLGNVAAASSAATDQAQKSIFDRLAADAANRGPGLSGGGDQAVLDQLAAQRANQAQTSQAFQSAGELQAARSTQLQSDLAAARQARGGELQGQLLNRVANQLAELRAEQGDLRRQQADVRTKAITDLRQQGFENLVTTRGLGLKQSQLAADVANQQAQLDLAAQRAAEAQRHNLADERGQRSSTREQQRALTVREQQQAAALAERKRQNTVAERLAQSRLDFQRAVSKAKKRGEPASAVAVKRRIGEVVDAINAGHSDRWLQNKRNRITSDELQAAHDLKSYGYLLPDTVRRLQMIGMQIPKEWAPPKQPPASSFGPH